MYYIQGKARKNSKTYGKTVGKYPTARELIGALTDEEIMNATKPYIFTHIQLGSGRIITCTTQFAETEVMCSPTKVWDAIMAERVAKIKSK